MLAGYKQLTVVSHGCSNITLVYIWLSALSFSLSVVFFVRNESLSNKRRTTAAIVRRGVGHQLPGQHRHAGAVAGPHQRPGAALGEPQALRAQEGAARDVSRTTEVW